LCRLLVYKDKILPHANGISLVYVRQNNASLMSIPIHHDDMT
jgi:hypothetical protein